MAPADDTFGYMVTRRSSSVPVANVHVPCLCRAPRLRAGDTPQSQLSSRNSVPSTSRRNRHSHLGALFGAHFRSSRNEAGDGWGTLDTAEWAMHVLTCCMLGAAPFDGGDDAVLTVRVGLSRHAHGGVTGEDGEGGRGWACVWRGDW